MKKCPTAISLVAALGVGLVAPVSTHAASAERAPVLEPSPAEHACSTELGGIDLGCLTDYLFVFADGSSDANWQASSKGYVGDVAVNGTAADERTSGAFPYSGTIVTDDSSLDGWERILAKNPHQAFGHYDQTATVDDLVDDLSNAINQIQALPVTDGFENRSSLSLDGLDTTNGVDEVIVIDVVSKLKVKTQIDITGDAGDVYILRWDTDADPTNGLNGQVKFQSGGAIVPHGPIGPGNFLHIAGDIKASGGGETPVAPYPQGPRLDNGTGELISDAEDFKGGGFFTGYWLTTGKPGSGKTSSLSNAVFVGGWYTLSSKFSMTSGTSGVHITPPVLTVSEPVSGNQMF